MVTNGTTWYKYMKQYNETVAMDLTHEWPYIPAIGISAAVRSIVVRQTACEFSFKGLCNKNIINSKWKQLKIEIDNKNMMVCSQCYQISCKHHHSKKKINHPINFTCVYCTKNAESF